VASLVDQWLEGEPGARTIDEASVSELRTRVRALGSFGGETFVESCAIIASELAHNHLRHAGEGFTIVRRIERDGVPGLEIVAADHGPGIPSEVFHGGRPSTAGLGAGLGGVQRLADEVDFDVRAGEGTCVRARKFAERVSPRRTFGVAGRPLPGSSVSGDQAYTSRTQELLIACAIDGVGHGSPAREASDRAVATLGRLRELDGLLESLDRSVHGERGCVLSHVLIDERRRQLEHRGVGNVTAFVAGPTSSRRFVSAGGIVGQGLRKQRRPPETHELEPGQLVVMHSDGLTTSAGLHDRPDLFHRPPIAAATYLLETFARPRDDAIVVVIG
jgi:anti-sigma regulatory factor (Ser/Thr protein kinase)